MPIRGLSDRQASFPEIGRVRKGAPAEPNKPGADLDYFRVVFDEAEETSIERFQAAYGEEPRELNVILPFNRIEDVWDAWMEAYTAGGLVHRSDGRKVEFHINPLNGQKEVIDGEPLVKGAVLDCPSADGRPVATYKTRKGKDAPLYASPVGRLKVVIAELNRFAFLTVMTGSQHDIANISAQLRALEEIHGKIAWIPLVLRRRPKMVSTPMGKGERVRTEKWLLSVEAHPEWVDAKLMAMEAEVTPTLDAGDLALLPIPEEAAEEALEGAWRQPDAEQPPKAEQEHPDVDVEMAQVPSTGRPPEGKRRSFTVNLMEWVLNEKLAPSASEAAKMLGLSPWADKDVPLKANDRPRIAVWMKLVNGYIDSQDLSLEDAAAAATTELTEMS